MALMERAEFADLAALAAHRQASWERQRAYVLQASALHQRVWAGKEPPQRLEALPDLPLVERRLVRVLRRQRQVHRGAGGAGGAMDARNLAGGRRQIVAERRLRALALAQHLLVRGQDETRDEEGTCMDRNRADRGRRSGTMALSRRGRFRVTMRTWPSSAACAAKSLRSSPEQKARPAPVSTMQRTSRAAAGRPDRGPARCRCEATTRAYVERIQDVTRAMVLGDTPVVGAIRGWAVGGGLEWVINCDFAIAAAATRFFFPEISWGVFVTGGVTELLPRLVGLQRARELMLLGEKFDAAQALAWGLLHKTVPDAELLPAALARARRIAALPAGPVRDLRRALARRAGAGLDAAMAAETEATVRGFLDPETARRVSAFS